MSRVSQKWDQAVKQVKNGIKQTELVMSHDSVSRGSTLMSREPRTREDLTS